MPIDAGLLARLSAASRAQGSDLSAADISQISMAYETIDNLGSSYSNYKIDTILEEAYRQEGGIDGEYRYVAPMLRQRTQLVNLDDEELLVTDGEGNQALVADNGRSRPATPVDLIRELRDAKEGFNSHFAEGGREEQVAPGMDSSDLGVWERLSMHRERARTAAR